MDNDAIKAATLPVDWAQKQLGHTIARHQDGIIEAVLRERISHFDMADMACLKGRLVCLVFRDGIRRYQFDGKPLVDFYPTDVRHDGSSMVVDQKYQVFA